MFRELLLDLLNNPVNLVAVLIGIAALISGAAFILLNPELFRLILKNLRRNSLRTLLTCLAIAALVFMITLIWTVISFLDRTTTEKSKDIKLIVTERWQLPSQMPPTHADYLNPDSPKFLPELKGLVHPGDYMSWSFYGGTIDPTKFTPDNIVFFFCMDPRHIIPMMEELDTLDPALVKKMIDTENGCLLGPERLKKIDKRVGERFKLTSINYKGIDLDYEIVGELPEGRYGLTGIMNAGYFNKSLDKYAKERGARHPLDQKRLNLIWLRVPDRTTFDRVGALIENSSVFADRPVKCETASSLIGNFLDAYRDLLMGVKYLLVPAILATMALVVANSISISVRERRTEMAVLKVLGFQPRQVLLLVLGEAALLGGGTGLVMSALTWAIVNFVFGGVNFQIGFFPAFAVPAYAMFWGLAMGFGTSLLGSFWPAWTARNVSVSEVFAKVA